MSKPEIVDFLKFTEQVIKLTSPYCSTGYEVYGRNIWQWDNLFRPGCQYQGTTFNENWEKAIIDVKTHFKQKPSSIYIFTSYYPPIVKNGFDKQEALRILRTNSSEEVFQISKSGWWTEAGHTILKEKLLLEVTLTEGKQRSWNKTTRKKKKCCLLWHNTSP